MIGISTGYRRIRINYGSGIAAWMSDKETKEVIDLYFVPRFKSGDYYYGTRDGIVHIINLLDAKRKR